MWALLGGSGFEKFEEFQKLESLSTKTPFGETSSGICRVKLGTTEMLFIPRHGEWHEKLPSEVNYRANIWALKKAGASKILSVSAIGSLKTEFKPGDLVVPNQYLDRTKSIRAHTFCGQGLVGHVSLAHPVTSELVEALKKHRSDFEFKIHFGGTYVCVEGPYFSTQAESKSFIAQGADIIGMSNFPEYALAREAGLGYLPACFVTDYDCWDDAIPHVTLEGVFEIMRQNKLKAFELCKKFISANAQILPKGCPTQGLQTGLMTPKEFITADQRQWLDVLLS